MAFKAQYIAEDMPGLLAKEGRHYGAEQQRVTLSAPGIYYRCLPKQGQTSLPHLKLDLAPTTFSRPPLQAVTPQEVPRQSVPARGRCGYLVCGILQGGPIVWRRDGGVNSFVLWKLLFQ